jgi:hypothetical protein
VSGCCADAPKADPRQRRALWIAFALNAGMAVIGGAIGWWAHSTGVLADALDMASDAAAYAVGLLAVGRSLRFKQQAARATGAIMLLLGLGLLAEVLRRAVGDGEPISTAMLIAASLSPMARCTCGRPGSAPAPTCWPISACCWPRDWSRSAVRRCRTLSSAQRSACGWCARRCMCLVRPVSGTL